MSDLDVVKACEAIQVPGMKISKEKIINSHVSWWPMRGPEKQVQDPGEEVLWLFW